MCDNKVNFGETAPDYDDCTVRKSHQLANPKTIDHKFQRVFQLVMIGFIGPFTPKALQGFKYAYKISDELMQTPAPSRQVSTSSQGFSGDFVIVVCGVELDFTRKKPLPRIC